MQAMIFAAGLGTRLRPLTNDRPKALVEVNGKPLLEHLILKLKSQGFTRLVVNVHHFGDKIISFLHARDNFGLDIAVSDERGLLLNTGGAIKGALPLFDASQPVLVHNADIVSDVDLAAFRAEAMCRNGEAATLLVSRRPTSRFLLFDKATGHLAGWLNIDAGRQTVMYCLAGQSLVEDVPLGDVVRGDEAVIGGVAYRRYAFSGIHLVRPELYLGMAAYPEDVFPIIPYYLSVCRTLPIGCATMPVDAQWEDCGKPESLAHAGEILCSTAYSRYRTTD